MQRIGQDLPSHGIASIGWRLAAAQAPEPSSFLVLAAWTAGCAALALLASRHRTARWSES